MVPIISHDKIFLIFCLLMLDILNFKISLKNMGVPAIWESYDVRGGDVIWT